MQELFEIYEVLKEVGLCETQTEFSQQWLGRSPHYVSQICGDPRKASTTSLRLLATELELTTLIAKHSSDRVTYRKIRSAWVQACTIRDGICEIRYVAPYHRITTYLH